jgi:quinol monooxygenase YgiN
MDDITWKNMTRKNARLSIWICLIMTLTLQASFAQGKSTYMRMAKITVDSVQLNDYLVALKTQMQSALKVEKGVLAYSAVQDKNNPNRITILETYASVAAYQAHIQTEHFKQYKATVADMVKALELTDVMPITVQSKQK